MHTCTNVGVRVYCAQAKPYTAIRHAPPHAYTYVNAGVCAARCDSLSPDITHHGLKQHHTMPTHHTIPQSGDVTPVTVTSPHTAPYTSTSQSHTPGASWTPTTPYDCVDVGLDVNYNLGLGEGRCVLAQDHTPRPAGYVHVCFHVYTCVRALCTTCVVCVCVQCSVWFVVVCSG